MNKISKAEAREILPLGACKLCVAHQRRHPTYPRRLVACSRCQTFYPAFHLMDMHGIPLLTPLPGRFTDEVYWRRLRV